MVKIVLFILIQEIAYVANNITKYERVWETFDIK